MIDYHLGVEDIEPDHFVAWVFELPGCYSSGRTADEAIHSAPARLAAYYDWRARHGRPSPAANAPAQVQVAETFHAFPGHDDPDYRVNAFFEDDRRPLTQGEVDDALWLLDGTRRDLLEVVERIPPEKRAAFIAGERFQTINGILRHVAIAEWWYFDRLDLGYDRDLLPDDPLERLAAVRQHTRAQLPGLVGDTRIAVRADEEWSARKVLRRTLWHEQDHTGHIARLVQITRS